MLLLLKINTIVYQMDNYWFCDNSCLIEHKCNYHDDYISPDIDLDDNFNNIYKCQINDNWYISDSIIFEPSFNKSLDKYIDIIKNYKKIVFSNYSSIEFFSNNNLCYMTNRKYYKCSLFNQPLVNSLENQFQLI